MNRAIAAGTATALLAGSILAAPAGAVTRAEFSASADAICRAQSRKELRVLKRERHRGGRPKGPSGFLRDEGRYDLAVSRAIDNSIRLISALPEPAGDEVILAQWLDSLHWDGINARDAARIARSKHPSIVRYFKVTSDSATHSAATELLVDGFGMRFCASDTHFSSAVSAGPVS